MWIDIKELNQFYKSPLGILTQELLKKTLAQMWVPKRRDYILGLGYPLPYLHASDKSEKKEEGSLGVAAMPSYQGVCSWPCEEPNRSLLVHEHQLPFRDCQFDKVLLAHVMGYTAHVKDMLGEVARVLTPQGEACIIVPHRFGLWSHGDHTPYGSTMPYSLSQLKKIVVESGLTPLESRWALYIPPLTTPWCLKIFPTLERWAQKGVPLTPPGVLILKALKQTYAPLRVQKVRSFITVLKPS